jgi:mycothiol synthase
MTEGNAFRSFRGDEDYAHLAAIFTASEAADSLVLDMSPEEIARLLNSAPRFNITRDLIIACAGDQPVAYGSVRWWEDSSRRTYGMSGFVHPQWRRKGIGRALQDWLEARAQALASENPSSLPAILHVNTTQYQVGLVALMEQRGYVINQSWSLMIRPSLADIPDTPLPEGLEVRPYRPEDLSAIWYAVEEAYVPEGGPSPSGIFPEDFKNDTFQPELWQVAWEVSSGKVVGSVMTYINYGENKAMGITRGYTEGISTVPSWQRRGVAKALIARSLKIQRDLGMTESGLVVSSLKPENRRLYESCGFKEVKRDTVYEKALRFE